jgi:hypothetical protein
MKITLTLWLILATLFGLWAGSVITKAMTGIVAVQLEYEQ